MSKSAFLSLATLFAVTWATKIVGVWYRVIGVPQTSSLRGSGLCRMRAALPALFKAQCAVLLHALTSWCAAYHIKTLTILSTGRLPPVLTSYNT